MAALAGETEHAVVSLTGEGVYGARLRQLGVAVHALGFPRGSLTPHGLLRLFRLIRAFEPDAVQTWMYHADLVGGVAARLAGIRSVCWNIRNSNLSPEACSSRTRLTARLCAWLSARLPAAIVSCSEQAAAVHKKLGYRASKFTVIQNGYDLSRFAPQPGARERLRSQWGIPAHLPLLGAAGRWDPQKDYCNLLMALALLSKEGKDFRCALAGPGMEWPNTDLSRLISECGLADKVLLLGPRDDIPDVMSALDLLVLSSYGEAFPNVVAEAMACGTPCAVTDVGDAALIVGCTGWVAPPRNPRALAQSIEQALAVIQSPRCGELSQACRQRIAECFGIERMAAAYKETWSNCRSPG